MKQNIGTTIEAESTRVVHANIVNSVRGTQFVLSLSLPKVEEDQNENEEWVCCLFPCGLWICQHRYQAII